jgi:hypothetical protein
MMQNKRRGLTERAVLRDPLLYLLDGLTDSGPGRQQEEHGTISWRYRHHDRRYRHSNLSRSGLQMSAH